MIEQLGVFLKRPGPQAVCSDSELIGLSLSGECKGWAVESELLSNRAAQRDLFAQLPTGSRFNRRRRNLMLLSQRLGRRRLAHLDLAQDQPCVIDRLPIPVGQFHRVAGSTGEGRAYAADFGRSASKQQTSLGDKLHRLMTLGGLLLDFELAPASASAGPLGFELLADHTDLTVIGDKADSNAEKATELWRRNRIRRQTLPRRKQKKHITPALKHLLNTLRQIVETVNGQLTALFNIETNHAHSFGGLWTHLYAKLTAHTLSIYINRLLGNPNFLQIKALAFPI